MADIYDRMVEHLYAHNARRIFDIGAGNGNLGLRLRKAKYNGQYVGLDRDPCAVERMVKKKLDGQEGDLRWYDGYKFYWDTVTIQDALEEFAVPDLLAKAFSLSRRLLVLATRAEVYDCLYRPAPDVTSFSIDTLIATAQSCSFGLTRYEQYQNHSILIFTRRVKHK